MFFCSRLLPRHKVRERSNSCGGLLGFILAKFRPNLTTGGRKTNEKLFSNFGFNYGQSNDYSMSYSEVRSNAGGAPIGYGTGNTFTWKDGRPLDLSPGYFRMKARFYVLHNNQRIDFQEVFLINIPDIGQTTPHPKFQYSNNFMPNYTPWY